MALGASRTFVSCQTGSRRVVGFYALAMGQILNQEAIGSVRRNMPRFIPAVVLGRLAVDAAWQGRGLGAALMKGAVLRSLRAAEDVSARLVVVHAISPDAEAFYLRHGFKRLPVDAPTLALDLLKLARL
ncbi:GNAT family N-acetyltransferase [Pleomorphomonas diazotrophica]|uniref:GNAT family N-acetyltransferase n=2 Tax=Pleomorphomonas diazotrophica TaxID=1166257 RepID=A0A2N3LTK6_9HYPH|nr:GNAT family N-acetyltransferase [Pleomorphomonas diazotrophica]